MQNCYQLIGWASALFHITKVRRIVLPPHLINLFLPVLIGVPSSF
jgi:hypothetical protein